MENLDQLKLLIGKNGLHTLNESIPNDIKKTETFAVLRVINNELNSLRNKVSVLSQQIDEKNDDKQVQMIYETIDCATQTDMLGLLHPDGDFVNLHLGVIKEITTKSESVEDAVSNYKKRNDFVDMETEIFRVKNEHKYQADLEGTASRRGRKKLVLRPYTVGGEKNEIKNVPKSPVEEQTPHATKSTSKRNIIESRLVLNKHGLGNQSNDNNNTCNKNNLDTAKPDINAVKVGKDNNLTLKCGQLISISKSKLTPLPNNKFTKPWSVQTRGNPSLVSMSFNKTHPFKPNMMTSIPGLPLNSNDDTSSIASSLPDVTELCRYLGETNQDITSNEYSDIELQAEGHDNSSSSKVPTSNSKMAENQTKHRLFTQWQLCDQIDQNGYALIHKAVLNNDLALLKIQCLARLSRNLDLNIEDAQNRTALQLAVLNNSDSRIYESLVSHKADQAILEHNTGNTLVHLAVEHTKDISTFKHIVKSCTPLLDRLNDEGYTALHLAVRHNTVDLPKVNVLLQTPNSLSFVNIQDSSSGRTALFYAMESNNFELVQMLLLYKADPHVSTISGLSLFDVINEIEVSPNLKDFFQIEAAKTKNKKPTVAKRPADIHGYDHEMRAFVRKKRARTILLR